MSDNEECKIISVTKNGSIGSLIQYSGKRPEVKGGPKVIKSTKLLAVDVDNTLVVWTNGEYSLNEKCVTRMKQFKARNHTIVVWSAGGVEWAEQVVVEFGLQPLVDVIMGKFDWFIDDKQASEFLSEEKRIKIEDL